MFFNVLPEDALDDNGEHLSIRDGGMTCFNNLHDWLQRAHTDTPNHLYLHPFPIIGVDKLVDGF